MTAPAFPVAPTAEAALHARLGLAARAGEASLIAGAEATLVTEVVGPAFATREAAAEAYVARRGESWCALRPVTPDGRPPEAAAPLRTGPTRWPERTATPALWRLQVTYWRSGAAADPEPLAPARRARRDNRSASLDARALGRLAAQPLQAVRPQQPLDIGLFEVRAPEAPDLILPDE